MARRKESRRRIPKDGSNLREYAKYTSDNWDALDPLYRYWGERWRRTIDFIRSQHWNVLKDHDLNSMPKWKRYPVLNYTLSIYNQYLTQWLQSRVRYSAVPASPDPADIGAANMAEAALRYSWDLLDMDAKRIEIGAWLLATGNACTRIYWSTDTGKMVPLAVPDPQDPENVIPVNPETMQPDPSMEEPHMVDAGELALDVVNPQLVRWPRSKRHGVMVGMLLTEDEVAERYSEEMVDKVTFQQVEAAQLADLSYMEAPGLTVGSDDLYRGLVIEHYLPRTKTQPGGLWWTSSGKEMITHPAELPGAVIPITQFKWIPLPGSRLGTTPLYDITFANKAYEEIAGKMQEWVVKVVPKRLLKEGGGLEVGEGNEEPGQELIVNVGGEPEWETPPGVPPEWFSLQQQNKQDMLGIGGFEFRNEDKPEQGQARGMSRAPQRQKDGQEVALAEINSKAAWQHMGGVVLAYMKKFYTQGRTLAVTGPDRQWEWFNWEQIDVERLPSTLKIDEMNLYSHNRQATRDTTIDLMNGPAANVLFSDIGPDGQPILDKDRVEIAMQAVGIDIGMTELDPDIAEARNEHVSFQMGEQVQAAPHMNHAVHLEEHSRVKKGITFRSWPEEAMQALDADVEGHQKALQQAQEQQQQQTLEMEKQMRMIKAQADVAEDVQKMLAKTIIEGAIGEALKGIMTEFFPNQEEKKTSGD